MLEEYVDPFPVTAADLDQSKPFTFNYVASAIRNHLNTRDIEATDNAIRELTEKILDDFWLMCCGGPDGGNPHFANFQGEMLDKLLNIRPKWPGADLDSNLPGHYLAEEFDDED